jgi:hypothetical protein
MKLFGIVLAAILVAGAIFVSGWGVVSKVHNWENRKREEIGLINQLTAAHKEIYEDSQSGSLETLTAAIRMMTRNEAQRRQVLQALKEILENKPFFLPLTEEESKDFAYIKSTLAAKKSEAESPTPTPARNIAISAKSRSTEVPTPAPTLALPQVEVTLTKDVSVQSRYGNLVLRKGTKLQLISVDGENLRFHYVDADYEIPISATNYK